MQSRKKNYLVLWVVSPRLTPRNGECDQCRYTQPARSGGSSIRTVLDCRSEVVCSNLTTHGINRFIFCARLPGPVSKFGKLSSGCGGLKMRVYALRWVAVVSDWIGTTVKTISDVLDANSTHTSVAQVPTHTYTHGYLPSNDILLKLYFVTYIYFF